MSRRPSTEQQEAIEFVRSLLALAIETAKVTRETVLHIRHEFPANNDDRTQLDRLIAIINLGVSIIDGLREDLQSEMSLDGECPMPTYVTAPETEVVRRLVRAATRISTWYAPDPTTPSGEQLRDLKDALLPFLTEVECPECHGYGCEGCSGFGVIPNLAHRYWAELTANEDVSDMCIHGPIGVAFAWYDSDPRVNGPDGFAAFRDAVEPLLDLRMSPLTVTDELVEACGMIHNRVSKEANPRSNGYAWSDASIRAALEYFVEAQGSAK